MNNEEIREEIRVEMLRQKRTSAELADELLMPRSTVWELTNGKTRIVNEKVLTLLDTLGFELIIKKKA